SICCYQTEATPERTIQRFGVVNGYVEMDGQRYDIRAQVHTIGGWTRPRTGTGHGRPPFSVIKRQLGYIKVRFRGLAKNVAQPVTLLAVSTCGCLRAWGRYEIEMSRLLLFFLLGARPFTKSACEKLTGDVGYFNPP